MAIVLIRTLIIYFALLLAMRLLGKRQLGEMELSEFVVAALIADLASHPLQDMGIPLLNGLVPILVLFCCEVIGTKLMAHLISLAIEYHVDNITLEVRISNEIARNLYKKFGFHEVAIRKYYYGDEDGILMEKNIM